MKTIDWENAEDWGNHVHASETGSWLEASEAVQP